MTDPPQSAGRDNLSVKRLQELINSYLSGELAKKIDLAEKASKFCRDWRNRRFAHRDLKLIVDEKAEPLTPGSREKVEAALQSLYDVLDSVSGHYYDSETAYDRDPDVRGGMSLLPLLQAE